MTTSALAMSYAYALAGRDTPTVCTHKFVSCVARYLYPHSPENVTERPSAYDLVCFLKQSSPESTAEEVAHKVNHYLGESRGYVHEGGRVGSTVGVDALEA